MTIIEYDVKQTGAEIRKALRAAFPGVKFSLTMSRGTGYGYYHLEWTDGPTSEAVERVTRYFESERLSSVPDDSTERVDPPLAFIPGHELPVSLHYSCRGVLTQRRFSEAALAWAAEQVHGVDEFGTRAHRVLYPLDLTHTQAGGGEA